MQQRLAIAQALAAKPRILLLDEPFGALDPGTREQMHAFLQDLRAETQMTVFMVTHDLPEAFKLGDRVLVFDKVRWDPHDPAAYGATITYDFDARNGGIPFQLAGTPATPGSGGGSHPPAPPPPDPGAAGGASDHPSSEGETA
jgi:NitT/TauT family transport system ATP-binding protein